MMSPRTLAKCAPWLTWTLGLIPLGYYVWGAVADTLGANPVEALLRGTGLLGLQMMVTTLALTPVRKLTGWAWLAPARRHLGLLAFLYATLHLSIYVALEQGLDLGAVVTDVVKRPFIAVGMVAFLLMVPLAMTSANRMVKLLGGARWKRLHQACYLIGVLGVVHYWMLVKRDITEPLVYAVIVAGLLAARVSWRARWGQVLLRVRPAQAAR